MTPTLPHPTREYRNHHLDSTRWQAFSPRPDDIVVTTSYKSGTTWMQQILHRLVFKGAPDALPYGLVSPWLDARFHGPIEEVVAGLEAQTHRRFIKSHLPFDGLPYHSEVKYVVVARDARDVFMSFWNHYRSYTSEQMERLNEKTGWSGDPLPEPPGDDGLHELWRSWITRGWFPWESEGWPFWGNLHHTRTCWPHRDLPNVELFHFADLLADPRGQIARLAEYLGFELSDDELDDAVEATSFGQMKKDLVSSMDGMLRRAFKDGASSFVFKGTNGRWRGVLTSEDLALYEAARERVLPPDCAAWLETGWLGTGSPGGRAPGAAPGR